MKRTGVFLCLIIFIICTIMLPAKADEIIRPGDSLNIKEDIIIDEEVSCDYQIQPTDRVVRVYNTDLRSGFTENDTIDEVLASSDVLQIYYVVKAQDGTWTCLMDADADDDFDIVEMEFVNYQALDACLSGEIVSRIALNAQVYNTYYLSGETMYEGTAIYYITDKGEYVHYFGGKHCIGEFLMPAKEFWELNKTIKEELSKNPYGNGGSGSKWDLPVYDLKSDAFDLNAESPFKEMQEDARNERLLWICISAGVCLAAAGVLFTMIRKRKTKTE